MKKQSFPLPFFPDNLARRICTDLSNMQTYDNSHLLMLIKYTLRDSLYYDVKNETKNRTCVKKYA